MGDEAAYWKGMTWITVAYVVAFIVGLLVGHVSPAHDPLWIALFANIGATVTIFGFSLAFRNTSFYDAYWSVAPIAIVGYWVVFAGTEGNAWRQPLVMGSVAFWGTRLTTNWSMGWHGLHHEDWRYVDLQHKTGIFYWPVSLFGLHLMPTLLVALAMWPAYVAVTHPSAVNALDIIAAAVCIAATFIEAYADSQLRAFRHRGPQPEAVMQDGLWNHSRHPNYFGEMSFWFGIWLFAVAADPSKAFTVVGALGIAALFRFVSIPMMETRQLERRPAYARYQARVSMVVPWFSQSADASDLEMAMPAEVYEHTPRTDAIGDASVRLAIDTMPFIPPPDEEDED